MSLDKDTDEAIEIRLKNNGLISSIYLIYGTTYPNRKWRVIYTHIPVFYRNSVVYSGDRY
jgi:hypothetical protein